MLKKQISSGNIFNLKNVEPKPLMNAIPHMSDIAGLLPVIGQTAYPVWMRKEIRKSQKSLRANHDNLLDSGETIETLVPSIKWILDNYYIISREAREVREQFRKTGGKVPVVRDILGRRSPRICMVIREIMNSTGCHFYEERLKILLEAYQNMTPLSISELWMIPLAIKACYLEAIAGIAEQAACFQRVKKDAMKMMSDILERFDNKESIMKEVRARLLDDSRRHETVFLSQVIYLLRERGIYDSGYLDSLTADESDPAKSHLVLIHEEAAMQTEYASMASVLIEGLGKVSEVDWRDFIEEICVVDEILGREACNVYSGMDHETKDRYRKRVESLAAQSKQEEFFVAKKVFDLTIGKEDKPGHTGYYLIGNGEDELLEALLIKPSLSFIIKRFFKKHSRALYYSLILLFSLGLLGAGMYYAYINAGFSPLLLTLLLFPPLFVITFNFSSEMTKYVFAKFLSRKRPPGMDYERGIPQEKLTMIVIPILVSGIKDVDTYITKLEETYLSNVDAGLRFALLADPTDHTQRTHPDDEQTYDHARYRIEMLNKKYAPGQHQRFFYFTRYRRWNEKENIYMAWERKRGKLEEFNRLMLGDYQTGFLPVDGIEHIRGKLKYVITIDQDTDLVKGSARKLVGIMAHVLNKPVVDEKKGRIMEGYAIMQPRIDTRLEAYLRSPFTRLFAGSVGIDPYAYAAFDIYQDLFKEGTFVGKGIYDLEFFASVLDGKIPENAVLSHDLLEGSYARCGLASDIQLADGHPSNTLSFYKREHRWIRGDWQLLPWIFGKDRLSFLSRWKMTSNLIRSFEPLAYFFYLIMAPVFFGWHPLIYLSLPIISLLLALIPMFTTELFELASKANAGFALVRQSKSILRVLLQTVYMFAILPYRAYIAVDAVIRTLWRLYISKTHLLTWVTAENIENKHKDRFVEYLSNMYQMIPAGLVYALAGVAYGLYVPAFFGVLFLSSPLLSYIIGKPYKKRRKMLKQDDLNELYDLARKTWRYFEEFFTAEYNYLVPDNYQVLDEEVIAVRTSPTNIGLQLMAFLSARDFGFISLNGFLDMVQNTLDTVRKLKKWHGNLYNWYDVTTLDALMPHYVSSVDSGNFVSYLITLKQGILDELDKPIFTANNIMGIKDVLAEAGFEKITLDSDRIEISNVTAYIKDAISEIDDKKNPWIKRGYSEYARSSMLSYLSDLEGLYDADASINRLCGENDRRALDIKERAIKLVTRLDQTINNTRLKLLYDNKKNLFHIGYNVTTREPDRSYYDLIASEARTTGFIATAKGEVPPKHWYKLSRPLAIYGTSPVLISWNGTMFEYFMPHIVMDVYPETIFSHTIKNVLKIQMKYAKKRNIPFGISESAYYRFDQNLNYQYRAFGIPELGFNAVLSRFLVIAPYASIMAIEVNPKAVIKNMKKLKQLGAYGRFGFYDAIDYISPENAGLKKPNVIRTFMCHHQGMILASLDNYLHDQIHRKRFHNEPIIRSNQFMLEETRLLGKIQKDRATPRSVEKRLLSEPDRSRARVIRDVHLNYPVSHVMSNDMYQVVIDSTGAGYSKFGRKMINFWDGEWISANYANCVYIKNLKTGKFYTSTYKPSMVEPDSYEVLFYPEKAEFIRIDDEIMVKTEIIVMTDQNGEIRRITLSNRSRTRVRLELTGYIDLILDVPGSYLGHPAFSKLFVETGYDAHYRCVTASRRKRDLSDIGCHFAAACIVENSPQSVFEYDTDRASFRGRGRPLSDPIGMEDSYQLKGITGEVVDPCIAMRTSVELGAGESKTVSFVYAVSEKKEELGPVIEALRTEDVIHDKILKAYYDSRIEMSYLGLDEAKANAILEAAACVIYPLDLLKGDTDLIRRNNLSQRGLWRFGISGDNPIILVLAKGLTDIDAIKDSALIYEYLRRNQIEVDLVIINLKKEGYNRDLALAISDVLEDIKSFESDRKEKSTFELIREEITDDEYSLLMACSDIVLSGSDRILGTRIRDSRKKQDYSQTRSLSVYEDIDEYPKRAKTSGLRFFNGYGGFDTDKDEYMIITQKGRPTPMPWINILANESFGCLVSDSGLEYTYNGNSRENKITPWNNDPITNDHPEIVYLTDSLTNQIFTITPLPVKTDGEYVTRHGRGYSIYEFAYQSLFMEQTVFVPPDQNFKYVVISIRNDSSYSRSIGIAYYAELVLGTDRRTGMKHIITDSDEEQGMLTAVNRYNETYSDHITYLCGDHDMTDYTCDKKDFVGFEQRKDMPPGMVKTKLSKKTGLTLDPCFCIKTRFILNPGEKKQAVFMLGQEKSIIDVKKAINDHCSIDAAKDWLDKVIKHWDKKLSVIRINTSDEKMNLMMNSWLLYQTISSRIYAKSAYYQAGGAFGFRDQLQDSMALLYAMPQKAREIIIKASGKQFIEGDVLHWWHDDTGVGIRTKISDDMLWLPYVLSEYVQITGDNTILDIKTPYLEGEKLSEDEYERFGRPKESDETADIYTHAKKAIQYAKRFGECGLPLIGGGDWNDGMNRIGHLGKGQSVWLGWFLYNVINKFKRLAKMRDDSLFIKELDGTQKQLKAKLDEHAWDGQWYLRAFFDDGTKVGSKEQAECKIDLLSQAWSVISRAGDEKKCRIAMDSVKKYLLDENEKMLPMLTPPFQRSRPNPGYIQGYLKGVRENGGQYTHAAVWAVYAFCMTGDNETAYKLFDMINPINHSENQTDVQKYKTEPYAIAADVYYNNLQKGRGGWSFYTGSAAWYYRAGLELLLGFNKNGSKLYIDPCMPEKFKTYSIEYEYGKTKYIIHVERNADVHTVKYITDGKNQKEKYIELVDDGEDKIIKVILPSKQ